jgi:CheY-like chemotaxis protein
MITKRVLVADEQPHSRELLRILLENEGCEVTEASDGLQAVEIACETLPDLVVLELELPRIDGYAVVRAMRHDSRLKGRAIVALTECLTGNDGDRLHEAGFTGFITKPLFGRVLRGQLAQLLSNG